MSGIDAIKGFDYQISYTLFLVVSFLKANESEIDRLKFESLNEEEEDFNIYYKNGTTEFIQIKKKDESNMWAAYEIRNILQHYVKNYDDNTKFKFITNGSANKDVKKLKKYLKDKKSTLSKKDIEKFKPDDCEYNHFVKILETVHINTLVMTSNNENNISELVKKETIQKLASGSFFLKEQALEVYDKLWKYIFDLSKNGKEVSFLDLKQDFNAYGVEHILSEPWLKFPNMNEFVGRINEMQSLTQISEKEKRISVFGISGIGKSYMVACWAKSMQSRKKNVCWISLRANMTYSKLIAILGSFVEIVVGIPSFKVQLENSEISQQIDSISNILEKYSIIFVLDSYEKASGNVRIFLNTVFRDIKQSGNSIMIVTTNQRLDLYNEGYIKVGKVYEYTMDELSYQDIILYYGNCGMNNQEIADVWEAIGGYPIANSLFMSYFKANEKNIEISELIDLTKEEKNQWIFNSIYKDLSDEEKRVLTYLASLDYGFNEYEEKIIERILKSRIKYVLKSLTNKNLLKYDGSVYYLHDTIRLIMYDQIIDDEKIIIHQLFEEKYSKRLFELKREEDLFLADKWGYHVCQLFTLDALEDTILVKILSLDNKLQFDLWGIWRNGFPYEFEDQTLASTERRIRELENDGYIIKKENKWKLNEEIICLQIVYLIEYVLKKRYLAISMALGYIPIFSINFAFFRQELICECEHCIEYMHLEKEQGVKSCPVFGHDCPEGEEHVIICKEIIEKTEQS